MILAFSRDPWVLRHSEVSLHEFVPISEGVGGSEAAFLNGGTGVCCPPCGVQVRLWRLFFQCVIAGKSFFFSKLGQWCPSVNKSAVSFFPTPNLSRDFSKDFAAEHSNKNQIWRVNIGRYLGFGLTRVC